MHAQAKFIGHHLTVVPRDETPPPRVGLVDPVFGAIQADGSFGRLGRYQVLKQLDCGGMGAVYLARDEVLSRWVALKALLPEANSPKARKRFFREARATSSIKHPSVVAVYEAGEDRGIPYIAMEYLQGMLLGHYLIRKGRLTISQAVRVGVETARGLAAAHVRGILHRDIKPGNLWLEAPNGRVRILDFGIARRINADSGPALTDDGIVVGTPDYMSPEQSLGKPLDHRADLFSLGAVLYELVTGHRPFQGETPMAVLASLTLDEPPAIRTLNPSVPPELERLIHGLLAKQPKARPASAGVVAEELRAIGKRLRCPASPSAIEPLAKAEGEFRPSQFEELGDQSESPRDLTRFRLGWGLWIAAVTLTLAAVLLLFLVRGGAEGWR